MTEKEINEYKLNQILNNFIHLYGIKAEKILSYVEKDINKLYETYAKNNNMTFEKAYNYLTDNDREEFQRDVKFYQEKVSDKKYVKEYSSYISALGTRARIRRLEYIKVSSLENCKKILIDLKNNSLNLLGEKESFDFRQKIDKMIEEMPTTIENKIILFSEKNIEENDEEEEYSDDYDIEIDFY